MFNYTLHILKFVDIHSNLMIFYLISLVEDVRWMKLERWHIEVDPANGPLAQVWRK